MNTFQSTTTRACPVCGNTGYSLFAEQKIDEAKLDEYSYASRKSPEFMRLKMVKCTTCDCIYAPNPPEGQFLEQAYNEAGYDSTMEADCAAKSYAARLQLHVDALPRKNLAVDVGAGNGALLPYLEDMGFAKVLGIEPSREAIRTAPDNVRGKLIEGMFSAEIIPDEPLSLFCSFATLEHIASPLEVLKDAFELLESGGMIAVSTHNYQGLLNRMLGLKSPIIDIEHLQLYCPKTLEYALKECGFTDIVISPIINRYPLQYWLRLLPLPGSLKNATLKLLTKIRCEKWMLSFPVGNLMAVARKA